MAGYMIDGRAKRLRRVLCATDLTTRSDAALHRAATLARRAGARFTVVHAVSDRQPERIVRLQINRAYVQLLSQLEQSFGTAMESVDVMIRAGHPRQVIVNAANVADSDLVVMAAPRAGRLDAIIGTTAERFIRATRRPVLVVHREVSGDYRRVAIAADLSDASLPMFETAVGLGVLEHAQATVVHALQPPYESMLRASGVDEATIGRYHLSHQQEAARQLESILVKAGVSAQRTRVMVRSDSPASAIRGVLELEQPELLTIGASRWFLLKRLLIGSVAADLLLQTAPADMLVIPNGAGRRVSAVARPVPVQRRLHQQDRGDGRTHEHA